jgi:hypothetical protein
MRLLIYDISQDRLFRPKVPDVLGRDHLLVNARGKERKTSHPDFVPMVCTRTGIVVHGRYLAKGPPICGPNRKRVGPVA